MPEILKELVTREPQRLLIFRVGHLGDTIIALPALWTIRRRFPEAHIALLSNMFSYADRVNPAQVIPREGLVDEWLTYPSSDRGGDIFTLARLLAILRRRRFDTLVYLVPRIRRPLDVRRDMLFFRLAGIRRIIGSLGFEPMPRKPSTGPLCHVSHETDHLLQRLSRSGIPIPPPGQAEINLALTKTEYDEAVVWLNGDAPLVHTQSLVGIGPGSKWPSKMWPEERFAETGQRLIDECGVFPIVFGGNEDRALGERLIRQWRTGANAAGRLSVRPAAAALSFCQLYVGNDTGTMHLAAAVRTPCIVTMSAQDWPGRWDPYGLGHTVLRRSVSCAGCMLQICANEGLRCLKEITVEEVLCACKKTLMEKESIHSRPSFLRSSA